MHVKIGGGYYARIGRADHGRGRELAKVGVKKADAPNLMKGRGVSFVLSMAQIVDRQAAGQRAGRLGFAATCHAKARKA